MRKGRSLGALSSAGKAKKTSVGVRERERERKRLLLPPTHKRSYTYSFAPWVSARRVGVGERKRRGQQPRARARSSGLAKVVGERASASIGRWAALRTRLTFQSSRSCVKVRECASE